MEKVYKGSDLIFNIKLQDKNEVPFRIADTDNFTIRFYTTDVNSYIECTYSNGEYKGILALDRIDRVVINDEELAELEAGIINYTYEFSVSSQLFVDNNYNEVIKGQTEFYLV